MALHAEKTFLYEERNDEKRNESDEKIESEKDTNIVCSDESGTENTLKNEQAWSPRGKLVHDGTEGRATEKLTVGAGLLGRRIVAPMICGCSMNSGLFNFWLENHLLPEIPKGSLVAVDNASFHKSEKTRELVQKFFCRLLFLPPCSPDLNPLEKFWASLKAKIKKISSGINRLSSCVEAVFQTI